MKKDCPRLLKRLSEKRTIKCPHFLILRILQEKRGAQRQLQRPDSRLDEKLAEKELENKR